MCFNAESSFTGAALLGIIMYATMRKVTSRKQYPLVSLIGFEVVMQLIEGFEWLAFKNAFFPSFFIPLGAYYFLIVAHFVWPLGFPFAFYVLETNPKRHRLLGALCIFAALISLGIAIDKFINQELPTAYVVNHSIHYSFFIAKDFMETSNWALTYLYGLIFVLIFFLTALFSSLKGKWILFFFTFVSFCIAVYYYSYAVTSVWCFFATVVAGSIYMIIDWNPVIEK